MMPYLTGEFGNPSSAHAAGRRARRAVDNARAAVAAALGAQPAEIYFTACGTESDNWALRAAMRMQAPKGRTRLITDAAEHHAILRTAQALRRAGYRTQVLGVDRLGRVSAGSVRAALDESAALVSVMAANNEVGTRMPVRAIAQAAHEAGALFHTDAVQAVGHVPIDVQELGVDMLSFSSHKFGGPKGMGGLYVRKGLPLPAGLYGGGQEHGLRSGTENVAGIVGTAAALTEACEAMEKNRAKLAALRGRLTEGILKKIPGAHLTGDPEERLPGSASFVFEGVEGEPLVLLLDQRGVCASSGSACSAGALEPSHVLLAMGLPEALARGSLRLTLGAENTEEEIDEILRILPEVVALLRKAKR
jgi:cysteine desulfurase